MRFGEEGWVRREWMEWEEWADVKKAKGEEGGVGGGERGEGEGGREGKGVKVEGTKGRRVELQSTLEFPSRSFPSQARTVLGSVMWFYSH